MLLRAKLKAVFYDRLSTVSLPSSWFNGEAASHNDEAVGCAMKLSGINLWVEIPLPPPIPKVFYQLFCNRLTRVRFNGTLTKKSIELLL